MPTYQEIIDRFSENLDRVENLISIYDNHIARSGSGRRPARDTDVLRAGLVLLHASLEDFFRSVAIKATPLADGEKLNAIPLAGSGQKNASKFLLGALSAHVGKTVDEVLQSSIQEYHERWTTFNDLGQLKQVVNLLGINADILDYGSIPEMIARRHRIVHHADSASAIGGRGNHKIASLRRDTVNLYTESVRKLIAALEPTLLAIVE